MDTDFSTTQERYADFMQRAPALINQTLDSVDDEGVRAFRNLVNNKKRVIFTGVGSSMPAAWHGADCLRQQGLPSQFLPTGSILGLDSLSADDVVVLSSQGVNRADALLIIDKVRSHDAALVLLTANRNPELREKATLIYYFDPAEEKLFCRPVGVAANYALMELLCQDVAIDKKSLVDAWMAGAGSLLTLPEAKRNIVLSSNEMMPVAWNVALALREGSGLHSELFDIETYGHGNYVGDLQDRTAPEDFGYVLVSGAPGSPSERSVRRILPFVQGIEAPYAHIKADYTDTAQSGMYILAMLARYVYDYNQANGYNMNKPIGKEENRYYHELDSYQS